MKLKKYKLTKIKNYIKTNNFFFIFNSNNLNLKTWIILEQQFKNLNLTYYKTHNTITKKTLENSIYANFKLLVNGLIILIKPKKAKLQFQTFLTLNTFLSPIGIKLNKKFYGSIQLKSLCSLNYKTNVVILVKSLKTSLKIPYKLTQNSTKFSK